jgi:ABC-type branched-subunit amino acid transport system ATPase component/ABC-type branched-subunit amino acid transport system permease subunit
VRYLYGAFVGIIAGSAYSLVGVSITLMYRSTGVLSFAHAAFAMLAAYVDSWLIVDQGWPRVPAAMGALCVAIAYGLMVELLAIRPARHASPMMRLVVTVAVLSMTTAAVLIVFGVEGVESRLLLPHGSLEVGEFIVSYQELGIFSLALVSAIGLSIFLKRTLFGTAVRAAGQDETSARLLGVSPNRVAQFNWGLGAALAGAYGILIAPLVLLGAGTFPLLLVKALTASLFGGLMSLPMTFLGGLVVGVAESLSAIRYTQPGNRELMVFLLILGLVLFRRSWATKGSDGPMFAPGIRAPSLTLRFPAVGRSWQLAQRGLRPLVLAGVAAFAVWALLVPTTSEYWGFVGARTLFYVIEALSLVILVGWAGQLSFMHGAYVGIGAFMTGYLVNKHGMTLELAIPLAALTGMALGGLAGLPALRLRGLQFAIMSLAFVGATSEWLFRREEFGLLASSIPRGTLFGLDLFESQNLYRIMLPVTAAMFLIAWNVRRSAFGSVLIASRDNPTAVEHFGASPRRTRMAAFLLASFFASLGGAFYGILLTSFTPGTFGPGLSLALLLYAMAGGVNTLAGPVLAGVLFSLVPQWLQGRSAADQSQWPDLLSAVALVAFVALRPGGLASMFRWLRGSWTPRRRTVPEHDLPVPASAPRPAHSTDEQPILVVDEITVNFGGVVANDRVSFSVDRGEIVALVGPNGAGKTTLFNVITGAQRRLASGSVRVRGRDVTAMPTRSRAALGLARSFQHLAVVPSLTVRQNVAIGAASRQRGGILTAAARGPWLTRAERLLAREVADACNVVGLLESMDRLAGELTYGDRRRLEIARAMVARPELLLLDEPSSGLDPSESAELASVVRTLRDERGVTVVLVEHDLSFVRALADRAIVLDFGHVIASGPTDEVLADDAVIDAYLGSRAVTGA